ncbi:MAG TPA: hypothetical protein VLN56_03090 [Gammaproteobacteria bacterium]|nr:hypothetical protein [Gammaproteobacteria bacterium]
MQNNIDPVKQFLALSELYLRLTGNTAIDVSRREMEEFLDTINDDEPVLSPEQYLC